MSEAHKKPQESTTRNKVIIACCVAIVAYYLARFVQNKGSDPVVRVNNGLIRGRVSVSRGGREFYEFLGIPYATPPVGELRFRNPKPVDNWKGILNARRYKPKCMQVDLISHLKSGSDSCLYLNVMVPKKFQAGNHSLPVLAFIHGGYYVSGHPSLYGPRYLMDEDIVLVTISYRLGALGFLNLGIKEASGNQGLKDQRLALTWIQQNIHHFGGDPNSVTIFGQSAGGSSVHFHMLSPKSKGLFHKAASHSGTVLSPWAFSYSGKEQAYRLAKLLDCPVNGTAHSVLNCLKAIDANKIVEEHFENLNFLHDPLSLFKPSIEEIDDDDAFLTKDPLEIMKAGNISNPTPWLIGVNSEEGLAVATVLVRDIPLLKLFQQDWQHHFRHLLYYNSRDESVPNKIRSHYFGNQDPFCVQSNLANFTNLFSEREYFLGVHQSANYHHSPEKNAPVYLFYFSQPVPLSFGDVLWSQYGYLPAFIEIGFVLGYYWFQRSVLGWINPNKGVTHVDDFTFLFHIQNIPEYSGGGIYEQLSKEMVSSWVTFAKTGKPGKIQGQQWNEAFPTKKSVSSNVHVNNTLSKSEETNVPVPQYLKIKVGATTMIDEPFHDGIKFWNSLNLSVYTRNSDDNHSTATV